MNYIKIFQNAHTLSISVGNAYSEDQPMHTFLDKFHQDGKYTTQITQRGLVVRVKYFGISHARGHRFRTAVSKA